LIQVVIAQNGRLLREAFTALLSREQDLRVVAESAHGDELRVLARRERPAVVVLHCDLPCSGGLIELCRTMLAELPDCGLLVILDPLAAAGAGLARLAPRVGLITPEASTTDLVDGIRRLARGQAVLDVEVAVAALTAAQNPLTDREREVLRLARHGAPAKEIARQLFLSAGTVRNYLSRAVAKTGARTRIEAVRAAQEAGWI
jgi:two-component system, NarL family, response regulator DesR